MLAATGIDEGARTARVERSIELTAETLWTEVAGRLRGALNESTFRTWFGEVTPRELTDDVLVVAVPNNFTREWIEGHFLGLMSAAVRDATGHERRVRLVVDESLSPEGTKDRKPTRDALPGLNPKYTFDLFVIG